LTLIYRSTAFFGLFNGGTAGLIYVYLGTAVGFAAVVASMAEMGSMYAGTAQNYLVEVLINDLGLQPLVDSIIGSVNLLQRRHKNSSVTLLAGSAFLDGKQALQQVHSYLG
jgi:hypothetical protein